MFNLAIEVCFKTYFEFIHAIFLLLESTKFGYFFGTPGIWRILVADQKTRRLGNHDANATRLMKNRII